MFPLHKVSPSKPDVIPPPSELPLSLAPYPVVFGHFQSPHSQCTHVSAPLKERDCIFVSFE